MLYVSLGLNELSMVQRNSGLGVYGMTIRDYTVWNYIASPKAVALIDDNAQLVVLYC